MDGCGGPGGQLRQSSLVQAEQDEGKKDRHVMAVESQSRVSPAWMSERKTEMKPSPTRQPCPIWALGHGV